MILKLVSIGALMMLMFGQSLKVNRHLLNHRSLRSSVRSIDTPHLSAIESTVAQYLTRDCKISANAYVLLSVSGGLDSMAMLHILSAISRNHLTLNLEVISFNHKLRSESDEEISFVSSWAEKYNLKFHERVLPENQRSLIGLQATARKWRRDECFKIISDQSDMKVANSIACEDKLSIESEEKVSIAATTFAAQREIRNAVHPLSRDAVFATAHHSDDQQETILLKFLRGAHISHLQPMLSRSDCGRVIHPLLSVTKIQLESYMREGNFEWREDSSNLLRKYKRNVVRLDLLPVMDQLAGGALPLKKRFEALAEQSTELQQWLNVEADKFFSLNAPLLLPHRRKEEKSDLNLSAITAKNQKQKQLSEISIEVDVNAPFLLLPSPLIQREIIQRMYRYISNGKTLGYDTTCNLLTMIKEEMDIGKREKTIQLDKDLLAVRIGNYLLFRIDESSYPDVKNIKNTKNIKDRNDSNGANNLNGVDDIADSGETSDIDRETEEILCRGVTVITDKILNVVVREIDGGGSLHEKKEEEEENKENKGAYNPNNKIVTLNAFGFSGSDGAPCSSVSISLYNIPSNSQIRIRFPRDGDRFQPDWRRSPVRVVEFFRSQKVPLHTRSSVPIISLIQQREREKGNAGDRGSDGIIGISSVGRGEEEVEEIICISPFVSKKYSIRFPSEPPSLSIEISMHFKKQNNN